MATSCNFLAHTEPAIRQRLGAPQAVAPTEQPEIAPRHLPAPAAWNAQLAREVRTHALGWLLMANAVGLLLAALLLWPEAGDWLGAFGYGRWVPLHLNWQLYGWCALPLVGALFAGMVDERHPAARTHVRVALGAWSLALFLGGVSWLQGNTSGKLFLDWHGWARPLLPVAMSVLWTVLAAHAVWSWPRWSTVQRLVRAGLLVGLLAVPSMLYWAAGREVYPSVNPHSGGATGASLLGSTLGIVTVFALLPMLLGVPRKPARRTGLDKLFWTAWIVSWAIFAIIDHGNASHRDFAQIAGLAVLLAWVPLLGMYGASWAWSPGARPWVLAAGIWWALLVVSGWVTFLPGISESWKFTHSLVGHAHLAMAGLVTSVNFVVLNALAPDRPLRAGCGLWQAGCALYVGLMLGLGSNRRMRAIFFTGSRGRSGFSPGASSRAR
jgi:cytochrome c oxidase cbb3-type subunit 1